MHGATMKFSIAVKFNLKRRTQNVLQAQQSIGKELTRVGFKIGSRTIECIMTNWNFLHRNKITIRVMYKYCLFIFWLKSLIANYNIIIIIIIY